jgi:NRPS condensation-like uncharacterized protein
VQYKFILIPKYMDGKGAVILKSHHCLADGLGFSFLFLAISDVWDKNALPALKPMGILKTTLVYTLLPFLVLKSGIEICLQFKDNNIIKKNVPMSGRKNGAYTEDIDLLKLKALAKANGATVNDFMTAVLSNTIYKYFDDHKNEKFEGVKSVGPNGFIIPKKINIGMPFSLRQPVKDLKDLKLNNDFAALPLKIGVYEKFEPALSAFKKQFKSMRTSLNPFGVLYVFKTSISLPFTLPKYTVDWISDKYTLIFSNLMASKIQFKWDGHPTIG